MKIYTDLHRLERKIVFVIDSEQVARLKLFRNNIKNYFALKSVQICTNLHKYLNNALSNDGSSIEIIDQSHELYIKKSWLREILG